MNAESWKNGLILMPSPSIVQKCPQQLMENLKTAIGSVYYSYKDMTDITKCTSQMLSLNEALQVTLDYIGRFGHLLKADNYEAVCSLEEQFRMLHEICFIEFKKFSMQKRMIY